MVVVPFRCFAPGKEYESVVLMWRDVGHSRGIFLFVCLLDIGTGSPLSLLFLRLPLSDTIPGFRDNFSEYDC